MSDEMRDRIANVMCDTAEAMCESWDRTGVPPWKGECDFGPIADAILALPGIAVVELPDGQLDERHGEMSWSISWPPPVKDFEGSLWVSVTKERWAYVEAHAANDVPTELLRKFAAALLAAAEYAERDQAVTLNSCPDSSILNWGAHLAVDYAEREQ